MYIVIHAFHDLEDDNYIYMPDDTYPRKGYKPDKARIEVLSTPENLIGVPLIKEIVKEDKETKKETRKKGD